MGWFLLHYRVAWRGKGHIEDKPCLQGRAAPTHQSTQRKASPRCREMESIKQPKVKVTTYVLQLDVFYSVGSSGKISSKKSSSQIPVAGPDLLTVLCQWLMRRPARLWRLHSFTCLSYSGLLHTFYSRWVPFGAIACLSCSITSKLKQGHKNMGGKIKSQPNKCPQSCWHMGKNMQYHSFSCFYVSCICALWEQSVESMASWRQTLNSISVLERVVVNCGFLVKAPIWHK